jgi:hypothetical protein
MTVNEVREFIEIHTIVARMVSVLLREVGDTSGDECIAFIVGGGLERNPKAVAIAENEYTKYAMEHSGVTAETAVQAWVGFYTQLGKVLGMVA